MTLAPLLNAPPAIQLPDFAAMTAFALGVIQLSAQKGTLPHRALGWNWVVLMAVFSFTAFFFHKIRLRGPWRPIQLLAITLATLPLAIWYAHRHSV